MENVAATTIGGKARIFSAFASIVREVLSRACQRLPVTSQAILLCFRSINGTAGFRFRLSSVHPLQLRRE